MKLSKHIWRLLLCISLLGCRASHGTRPLLVKDSHLNRFFVVSNQGVQMYSGAASDPARHQEIDLPWAEVPTFIRHLAALPDRDAVTFYLNYRSLQARDEIPGIATFPDLQGREPNGMPLAGIRIALDPGHSGGDATQAAREHRLIKLRQTAPDGHRISIQLNEGNLTYATALLLKQQLQRLGAVVLLTRNGYGETAFGYPYERWKQMRLPLALADCGRQCLSAGNSGLCKEAAIHGIH